MGVGLECKPVPCRSLVSGYVSADPWGGMEKFVVDQLRESLGDRITTATDPAYDEVRTTFNATVQRRPAVIVRARSDDDVVKAVVAAADLGLPIAIRGGGHSVAGHGMADGALVVDLRDLRDVTVDPATRLVRARGGALWEDLDAAAWAHHLAVVGGTFGDTGVAGLTLGGGIGWLSGIQGFTCDNLVRAEVVTAAGERVIAGPDGDPDLLWALRGGGGNFGVVTTFEFRAGRSRADPGRQRELPGDGPEAGPAPDRAGRGGCARRARADGLDRAAGRALRERAVRQPLDLLAGRPDRGRGHPPTRCGPPCRRSRTTSARWSTPRSRR